MSVPISLTSWLALLASCVLFGTVIVSPNPVEIQSAIAFLFVISQIILMSRVFKDGLMAGITRRK